LHNIGHRDAVLNFIECGVAPEKRSLCRFIESDAIPVGLWFTARWGREVYAKDPDYEDVVTMLF